MLRSRTERPAARRRPGEFAPSTGKFLPQRALLERYLQGSWDGCQGNRSGLEDALCPGSGASGHRGGRGSGWTRYSWYLCGFITPGAEVGILQHCKPLQSTLLAMQREGRGRLVLALGGNLVATWTGLLSPTLRPRRAAVNFRVLVTHPRGTGRAWKQYTRGKSVEFPSAGLSSPLACLVGR